MSKAIRTGIFVILLALLVDVALRGRADMQLLVPVALGVIATAARYAGGRARRRSADGHDA